MVKRLSFVNLRALSGYRFCRIYNRKILSRRNPPLSTFERNPVELCETGQPKALSHTNLLSRTVIVLNEKYLAEGF